MAVIRRHHRQYVGSGKLEMLGFVRKENNLFVGRDNGREVSRIMLDENGFVVAASGRFVRSDGLVMLPVC